MSRGEFVVPRLVRIDLTEAEPGRVALHPQSPIEGTDIDRVARDVSRILRLRHPLRCFLSASISGDRSREQPTLVRGAAPSARGDDMNALFALCRVRRLSNGIEKGGVEVRDGRERIVGQLDGLPRSDETVIGGLLERGCGWRRFLDHVSDSETNSRRGLHGDRERGAPAPHYECERYRDDAPPEGSNFRMSHASRQAIGVLRSRMRFSISF